MIKEHRTRGVVRLSSHKPQASRRLADLLAIAAGELLSHRLDHLPLARHYFQRARHVLVELAKAIAAAAFTMP